MNKELELVPTAAALNSWTTAIATGRDPKLEQQLIAKSQQAHIVKNTPNDSRERFVNESSFEKWLAKDREIHWLLGPNHDLAGIIWYGPKPFPLQLHLPHPPTETFAIRLYEGYLGRGLSVPFMRQSLRLHCERARRQGRPVAGIWAETDLANPAARATYAKLGYEEVATHGDRVVLVLTSEHIRQLAQDHGIMKKSGE